MNGMLYFVTSGAWVVISHRSGDGSLPGFGYDEGGVAVAGVVEDLMSSH